MHFILRVWSKKNNNNNKKSLHPSKTADNCWNAIVPCVSYTCAITQTGQDTRNKETGPTSVSNGNPFAGWERPAPVENVPVQSSDLTVQGLHRVMEDTRDVALGFLGFCLVGNLKKVPLYKSKPELSDMCFRCGLEVGSFLHCTWRKGEVLLVWQGLPSHWPLSYVYWETSQLSTVIWWKSKLNL